MRNEQAVDSEQCLSDWRLRSICEADCVAGKALPNGTPGILMAMGRGKS